VKLDGLDCRKYNTEVLEVSLRGDDDNDDDDDDDDDDDNDDDDGWSVWVEICP